MWLEVLRQLLQHSPMLLQHVLHILLSCMAQGQQEQHQGMGQSAQLPHQKRNCITPSLLLMGWQSTISHLPQDAAKLVCSSDDL